MLLSEDVSWISFSLTCTPPLDLGISHDILNIVGSTQCTMLDKNEQCTSPSHTSYRHRAANSYYPSLIVTLYPPLLVDVRT